MERIWDQFLSDRDRQWLERFPRRPRMGFGSRPALVIVDNINKTVGPRGEDILATMRDQVFSMGHEAWAGIDATATLLDLVRRIGLPVVHVSTISGINSPWDFLTYQRRPDVTFARDHHEPEAGWRIVDALTPRPDELHIQKAAPSAFFGTPLLPSLIRFGVDTLVVCGNSTSGCIRATVLDAASHAFKVVIPEECVFDRTEASHAMNLFDMDQKYADVLGVEEVARRLADFGAS
ncbi:isochorismatase family protein [Dactylosporangium fulvum]|uniref:Isochorismatase family protein n=1 Tax=Dactylosporangium fulvum TaxID=53359 RepID=A0ABY5VU90_9ACTN|nr:isochorismatase family protein [Dactylosporangium fulvum]UWP80384.1 isochorismatase family protein [Dactylosporangium fulvum]